jgi:hypothetical protein
LRLLVALFFTFLASLFAVLLPLVAALVAILQAVAIAPLAVAPFLAVFQAVAVAAIIAAIGPPVAAFAVAAFAVAAPFGGFVIAVFFGIFVAAFGPALAEEPHPLSVGYRGFVVAALASNLGQLAPQLGDFHSQLPDGGDHFDQPAGIEVDFGFPAADFHVGTVGVPFTGLLIVVIVAFPIDVHVDIRIALDRGLGRVVLRPGGRGSTSHRTQASPSGGHRRQGQHAGRPGPRAVDARTGAQHMANSL